MTGWRRSRRGLGSSRALALAGASWLLVASSPALAGKRPSKEALAEAGIADPRAPTPPRRHRFRLALLTDYVRATQACSAATNTCQRFHFAPLLLDLAYQLQFLRYAMVRASFAFGANAGNSRQAMPAIVQPGVHVGFQGASLGAGFGYSYIVPFPVTPNATNGRGGLGQPALTNNHVVAGEVSLTTRIDRGALNFALRVGGMRTQLRHFDLDRERWFPSVTFSAGWFFGPRRSQGTAPSRGGAKPIE